MGPPLARVVRRLPRPVGARFHLFVGGLAAAMAATGVVQPRAGTTPLFVAGLALFGLWWSAAGWWLSSAVGNLLGRRGREHGRDPGRASWWRWAVAPPVVVVLLCSPSALNLKFWIARPGLERLVAAVRADPSAATRPAARTVWPMAVWDVRPIPGGGVRFATYGVGHPLDYNGLAFSPQPLPAGQEVDGGYYRPYCGPWYTFWRPSGDADERTPPPPPPPSPPPATSPTRRAW